MFLEGYVDGYDDRAYPKRPMSPLESTLYCMGRRWGEEQKIKSKKAWDSFLQPSKEIHNTNALNSSNGYYPERYDKKHTPTYDYKSGPIRYPTAEEVEEAKLTLSKLGFEPIIEENHPLSPLTKEDIRWLNGDGGFVGFTRLQRLPDTAFERERLRAYRNLCLRQIIRLIIFLGLVLAVMAIYQEEIKNSSLYYNIFR